MTELGKVIQASNIQGGESVKTESFNDVTELETLAGPIVEYLKTKWQQSCELLNSMFIHLSTQIR